MNTIDAMKLALEALENSKEVFAKIQEHGIRSGASAEQMRLGEVLIYDRAITALEQAIKQKERQPALVKTYSGGKAWPVQTEWVGLTDDDRRAAFESLPDMLDGFLKTWGWLHFSKAIEAKLKEKNAHGKQPEPTCPECVVGLCHCGLQATLAKDGK